VNFDDVGSEHVRRFVVENVLMWAHEYHIDGFRFDATDQIKDDSEVHLLAEVSEQVRSHPRPRLPAPYLIAESEANDVRYLHPVSQGGYGFDAVWADDFHHAVRTLITPDREGYLGGYSGTLDEVGACVSQGFLYEGQPSPVTGRPRGTKAREVPWTSFVYCIQNHDQVGNRAFGDRLHESAGVEDVLAATLLLLLLPQTPLLFQGQEFLASSPFQFFTDHDEDLGRAVTAGRREEFADFSAFRDPETRSRIPDPQAETTFLRSKLDYSGSAREPGASALALHRDLLALRRGDPVLRAYRRRRLPLEARVEGDVLVVRLRAGENERALVWNRGSAPCSMPDGGHLVVASRPIDSTYGADVPPRAAAFIARD
jgi:maltooligosyltrehalose trehalohydrolase